MMKEFSCDACHRLFDHYPSKEEHNCEGQIQKGAVQRFQEFLLRSALRPLTACSSSSSSNGNQEFSLVPVAHSSADLTVNEPEAVTQPSSRKRARSECDDDETDQSSNKLFCSDDADYSVCSDPVSETDELSVSYSCISLDQSQTHSSSAVRATVQRLGNDASVAASSLEEQPEISVHRRGVNLTSAAGADVGKNNDVAAVEDIPIIATKNEDVESERNASRHVSAHTEDVDRTVAVDECSALRSKSHTKVSDSRLPSTTNMEHDVDLDLSGFDQLIFLDIDNWSKFFHRMPGSLPEKTFVWGFYGGKMIWKEPTE
jgi:hypothetical protein